VRAATSGGPNFSSTHFVVTVDPNGSATWTFQYRTHLGNDSQRRRFREFAKRFEGNDTSFYRDFRRNARSLVADAQNASSRHMNASHFSRNASVRGLDANVGLVQMSFTWSAFARVEGSRVVVGDLFQGGLYLGPSQWLVVRHTGPLRFRTVVPTPNETADPTLTASDSVTWRGPREFADERPRIVLVEHTTSSPGSVSGSTGGGASPATPNSDGSSGALSWPAVGAVALLLVVLVGVYWSRTRERTPLTGGNVSDTTERESSNDTAKTGDGPEVVPAVTDEELLPDDERVTRLLAENGGRMRQVSIVEETGWSKSKVSMLLSEMEEAGQLSRIRIGRENVVSLPGYEPDAAGP